MNLKEIMSALSVGANISDEKYIELFEELRSVKISHERDIMEFNNQVSYDVLYKTEIIGLLERTVNERIEIYIFIMNKYRNNSYELKALGKLSDLESMTMDEKNQKLYFMNKNTREIAILYFGDDIYKFYTAINFYKNLINKKEEL